MNSVDLQTLLTDEKQFRGRVKVMSIFMLKGRIVLFLSAVALFINAYVTEFALLDSKKVSSNYWEMFFSLDLQNHLLSSLLLIAAYIGLIIGVTYLVMACNDKESAYANAHSAYLNDPEVRIYNTVRFKKFKLVFIESDLSKQLELEQAISKLLAEDKKVMKACQKYIVYRHEYEQFIKLVKYRLWQETNIAYDFYGFYHHSIYKLDHVAISDSVGMINTTVSIDGIGPIELTTNY